jgi:hypothetical protein
MSILLGIAILFLAWKVIERVFVPSIGWTKRGECLLWYYWKDKRTYIKLFKI